MAETGAGKKLIFPATARNREPIAEVLDRVLPKAGTVLELASGSGEHAVFFAARYPSLIWQPTDLAPAHLDSIAAWADEARLPNLRPPLRLDATALPWPVDTADVVIAINLIHIAPWEACVGLMEGAAAVLPPGGLLILYGPYKVGGVHTAPSNEAFDEGLRSRDPSWGVRDREAVEAEAKRRGLELAEAVQMPANNLTLVFRKG